MPELRSVPRPRSRRLSILTALPIVLPLAFVPAIARAADGALDASFSGDGLLVTSWNGGAQRAHATAVAAFPDGSLLVAGDVEATAANADVGFVRLNAAGVVIGSWGNLGRRLVAIDAEPGGDDSVAALAVLADGSAIAAGFATQYFPDEDFPTYRPALVRLNDAGDLEPTFGNGGVAIVDLPWASGDFGLVPPIVQPDGKAIYAGYCYDCPLAGDGRSTLILRIGTNGLLDPTFSGDGLVREATGAIGEFSPSAIAVDGAGRILLIGNRGLDGELLRLTASGALDASFGSGGVVSFPRPTGISNPYGFAVDGSSGAIYLAFHDAGGPNEDYTSVLRFLADGTPDATFGGDGVVELVYQERIVIESILVQSDGKIVLGGYRFDEPTIDREWMLYRLAPTGALDPAFDGNGRRVVDFGEPLGNGDQIHAMTLAGGKLVAVGTVEVSDSPRFGTARLTSDLLFRDGFGRGSTGAWAGN